jgi:hypothetical protein
MVIVPQPEEKRKGLITMTFETLEQNAKRAKEAISFSDYESGSATAEYLQYCKHAEEIATKTKKQLQKYGAPAERMQKIDYLLSQYKAKKLTWLNSLYANQAKVPSILVAGGSNFPVRAKQKQNAREDALLKQNPDYILDKISGIGRNAGTIYSNDKDAVNRIKSKIAELEAAPRDPWGYNKAEIRRLKERLFALAPEEFKEEQSNITVNGAKTYKDIVALWKKGSKSKAEYDGEAPRWYYNLPLVFYNGKRHYKGFVSIEVDESGENQVSFNIKTMKSELIPLTDTRKYNLIIQEISGSGNKNIMYQYLKSLIPKEESASATNAAKEALSDTVTISGEKAQVVRNKEIMRLQLIFDGKPSAETRKTLKANGFRWAPSQTAWQRLLNENSEAALKRLA